MTEILGQLIFWYNSSFMRLSNAIRLSKIYVATPSTFNNDKQYYKFINGFIKIDILCVGIESLTLKVTRL